MYTQTVCWGETVCSLSSTIFAAPLRALELSPKYCKAASRSSARSVRRAAGTAQIAHTNVTVLPTAPTTPRGAAVPSATNHEKKSQQVPNVGEERGTGSEGSLGPRKVDAPSKQAIKSVRKDWMPINLNLKAQEALSRSRLPRRSNTDTLHLPSHLEKGHLCFPHSSALCLQGEQGCTRRLINMAEATRCPHVRVWHGTQAPAPCPTPLSPPPRRGCSLFSVPLQPY